MLERREFVTEGLPGGGAFEPCLGGTREEFESEVSSLSSGIHVVVQSCIGMEKFEGKEVTFVTEWLQRGRHHF